MNTKTSKQTGSSYVGDPVLHKTNSDNERAVFQSRFLWAEKGGELSACIVVSVKRVVVSFLEDPNSVKTNFLKFKTNYNVYSNSNHPTVPCDNLTNQQGVSVGIWYNPDITDVEIDRQTKIMGGPWSSDGSLYFPGDISQFVIQPNDANYTGSVYAIIRHSSTGFRASAPIYEFSDYQYEVKR